MTWPVGISPVQWWMMMTSNRCHDSCQVTWPMMSWHYDVTDIMNIIHHDPATIGDNHLLHYLWLEWWLWLDIQSFPNESIPSFEIPRDGDHKNKNVSQNVSEDPKYFEFLAHPLLSIWTPSVLNTQHDKSVYFRLLWRTGVLHHVHRFWWNKDQKMVHKNSRQGTQNFPLTLS